MNPSRYDALVVGAGPAGALSALVLARGGARVALVDKAAFPRDKACGDLIGPRGVQVLDDVGIVTSGRRVGDMEVLGPTGRRVTLRAAAGFTYPGYGVALERREFDARLRQAAIDAGAEWFTGRAGEPRWAPDGELEGFDIAVAGSSRGSVPVPGGRSGTVALVADVVVGADGALSRVGAAAGLVEDRRVLWGFAMRGYAPGAPALPQIVFWEPSRGAGYPGYGWLFPGPGDQANIGLGVGFRGDRRAGARAARDLEAFVAAMRPDRRRRLERKLGGWLKLGMVGTTPARGRTLLVGDAAGLVNPLQGEGIAQALLSGRAAAQAILAAGPSGAAARYREEVAARFAPYASSTVPITGYMVGHPRLASVAGRVLTAPGIGTSVAPAWSIYWNNLLAGARPGPGRRLASVVDRLATVTSGRLHDARSVWCSVAAGAALNEAAGLGACSGGRGSP